MSIFVEKDGKKTLSRLFYIKVLFFAGIMGLSAVIMQPLQVNLKHSISQIQTDFIEKLEDITGTRIQYSSLRPTFFGSFDIRNLKLVKDDTPLFTVYRIRIRFSIPEMLFRKKTFIHTVQIDRPQLRLDTDRDKEFFQLISNLINRESDFTFQQIAEFLPKGADLQIRQFNLYLADKQVIYQIQNLNFNFRENEEKFFLGARFNVELRYTQSNKTYIIRSDIGVNGECSNNFENADADIIVYYISGSEQILSGRRTLLNIPLNYISSVRMLFNVSPVNLSFNFNDSVLGLKANNEEQLMDFFIQYNTDTGQFLTEFNFDNFTLAEKVTFTEYWRDVRHLLQLQITGNLSFRYEDNGQMEYNVDLTCGNFSDSAMFTDLPADSFIIKLTGDEKEIIIDDFRVSSSVATAKAGFFQGIVGLSGSMEFAPLKPSGTVFFDRFSLSGNETMSTVLYVSNKPGEIQIVSEKTEIAQTWINELDIVLVPSERDIGISISSLGGNGGVLFLDAVFNQTPRELEASLTLNSFSVYELTEYIKPFSSSFNIPSVGKPFLRDSLIDTDIFFSTDFNNFVYNAPSILFYSDNINGRLSLSGTDSQFSLSESVIYNNDNEFLIAANLNFANPMDIIFSAQMRYHDMSWNLTGQIFDRSTLIIREPNGFNVYANIIDGALSGFIEGVDFPIIVNSQPVYLNFFMNMRYNSSVSWNVDVNHFTASNVNSTAANPLLNISGNADQDGASFHEIRYSDSIGELAGNADFSWDTDFSNFTFTVNITDGFETGEYYYLEGLYHDGYIRTRVSVHDMRINRFFRGRNTTLVSADMDASWNSIDLFNVSINVTSISSALENDIVFGSVGINISNDDLIVSNLRVNYGSIRAELNEFIVNRLDGNVTAFASVQGITIKENLEGNISLNVNFNPLDSWLDFSRALHNFTGTLGFENFIYGDFKHEPHIFVFAGNEGAFSISGGVRNMLRFQMDSEGNFFAGLSAPFPIHASIAGTYRNGIIDASCNNFYADLAGIWSMFVNIPEFIITSGYITGAIDILGPIGNPEFFGNARASSMRFQIPNFITEDLRPVPFNILAQGYEMTFGPVATPIGSGGGTVSGWFLFGNWIPVNIGLDIFVPRETPIPYGFNISGFLANGTASGTLNLLIDVFNLVMGMNANLFSNNAQLGMNIDEIIAFRESGRPPTRMDVVAELSITAGSSVEFAWPSTIPTIRANPVMGTVIYISNDTHSGQFSLNSDVRIRSGEVYYLDRSFIIRQGNIVFRENETNFDPRFSTRAEIRDRTDTGPVTISMIVENQPLLSFEPRFEATPGLTQLEIFAILGQNFGSNPGEDNLDAANRLLIASGAEALNMFINTSDVLSQFVFFRQVERQVRNFFNLDMFSIRTRFIQNAVVTGTSGIGQPAVDRNNRVGNYFDNTTVFIGKYIGQNMFAQAMLSMKYDENRTAFGGLRIEPDIGIELQSPFLNIRWDFFPNHPENWYFSDHSITLSWSKSFY